MLIYFRIFRLSISSATSSAMSLQPFSCAQLCMYICMYARFVRLSSRLCVVRFVLLFTTLLHSIQVQYSDVRACVPVCVCLCLCVCVRALVFYIHKMSHAKYRNNVADAKLYTCTHTNTHTHAYVPTQTYLILMPLFALAQRVVVVVVVGIFVYSLSVYLLCYFVSF